MGFNPATGQWEPEDATTAGNALGADPMAPPTEVRATPLVGPNALQSLLAQQTQQRNRHDVAMAMAQQQQALAMPPATPYLGRQRYRPANVQKGMMAVGDALGQFAGDHMMQMRQGSELEALRQQLEQQQMDAAQYQRERESA